MMSDFGIEQNCGESEQRAMDCYPSRGAGAEIDISDVLEAIETTDPTFVEQGRVQDQAGMNVMLPNLHIQSALQQASDLQILQNHQQQLQQQYQPPHYHHQNQRHSMQQSTCSSTSSRIAELPKVEITEQPASKAMRFRYECEGRSAGSIPGVNSTSENKTYPTIKITGYKGRAIVVVSCVTKDGPKYRPHPHNLVGKESCQEGVCKVQINPENMTVSFANLGIQCVKRKDIEAALNVREKLNVDPFKTGFGHKKQPTSIDLNSVRLCFQVFLDFKKKGEVVALEPVVSEPIYDKKAMSDLTIVRLSHYCTDPKGQDMILLCEKVAKEDIQVRFFEERDGHMIWEGYADFTPQQVHKQVAIIFKTPAYNHPEHEEAHVFIQLKRPSDGATSEPLPFEFKPNFPVWRELASVRRKRHKMSQDDCSSPKRLVLKHMQSNQANLQMIQTIKADALFNFGFVKKEPDDTQNNVSPYDSPEQMQEAVKAAAAVPDATEPYGYKNPSPITQQPIQAVDVPFSGPNNVENATYVDLNVIQIQQSIDYQYQMNPVPDINAVDMGDLSLSGLLNEGNNSAMNSRVSLTGLENMLEPMLAENMSNVSLSEFTKGLT